MSKFLFLQTTRNVIETCFFWTFLVLQIPGLARPWRYWKTKLMEARYSFGEAVWHGLLLLGNRRGLFYITLSLVCKFQYVSGLQQRDFICIFFLKQECDQVHIEDVASDDNGQDLRWCTVECMKCTADVIGFLWGLQTQIGLRGGGQHCAGDETWRTVFVCWVFLLWRPIKH